MSDKKYENRIIFISWLAYASAYVGRLNYSAAIVAIVSELGITKAQAGLVSSMFFFAYGIGQLVNGILSRKYNSRIMVFLALTVSAALNIAMPLSGNISVMKYLWLANGAFQSILWSTLIKTVSEKVSDEKLPRAIVVMSTPVAAGTIVAYGASALFVKFLNWRYIFFFSSAVLIAAAFIWLMLYGKDGGAKQTVVPPPERGKKLTRPVIFCLVSVALAGICNGFIKDGLNTWVSSVLNEEFGISQSFSIMLTLLLPLVSLAGATAVERIHKKITSHSKMDFVFYLASTVTCAGVVVSLRFKSFFLLMASFILTACLMSMINNVITSVFPLDMRRMLGSGFLAGLLNTFCYVGSTVTSYSLGAVAQRGGWNNVFLIMLAVSAFAAAVSLPGMAAEKKSFERI